MTATIAKHLGPWRPQLLSILRIITALLFLEHATAKLFADSPYRDQFGWVCRTVGVDRLLWASDFPLDDPRESLASLTAYGFDEAETRQITHDNAARLFDLDG